MILYKLPVWTKTLILLLFSSQGFTQEQWEVDQAAGKYWYAENGYLYTHDPAENNPGTLFVVPQEDGELNIAISPELQYQDVDKVPVKYTFNRDSEQSLAVVENWSTFEMSGGILLLSASAVFVHQFEMYANKDGYIKIEITDSVSHIFLKWLHNSVKSAI